MQCKNYFNETHTMIFMVLPTWLTTHPDITRLREGTNIHNKINKKQHKQKQ